MLKNILSIFILSFPIALLTAQTNDHLLVGQDSIFVELGERNEIIYPHAVKAKQTIYRIARTFEQSPTLLLKYNGLTADSIISINQMIKVPISQKYIDKSVVKPYQNSLAVVYRVKAKETIYGISKTYFDQPIENLIARNSISDFNLSIGENLVVGWIGFENKEEPLAATYNKTVPIETKPVPKVATKLKTETRKIELPDITDRDAPGSNEESLEGIARIVTPELDSLNSSIENESAVDSLILNSKLITSKGIAKWNKSGNDLRNLFVMHRHAKINSLIQIRNPMNNRTVEARVVGHIQKNMVSDDISTIISPAVAHRLGILDSRALVEISYME